MATVGLSYFGEARKRRGEIESEFAFLAAAILDDVQPERLVALPRSIHAVGFDGPIFGLNYRRFTTFFRLDGLGVSP